jgi:hypothetical protein
MFSSNGVVRAGLLAALVFSGCAGSAGSLPTDSEILTAEEEDTATVSARLADGVPLGSELAATANLNLRTGPGTGYTIRLVIPQGSRVQTINRGTPSGSWYNVKFNGVSGWSHGGYLRLVSSGAEPAAASADEGSAAGALARARTGVGFSYYWGHGRWEPSGATASNRGACYGNCPECTHQGAMGADCSGYVAKAWQVPGSNVDLATDSHPYGTTHFARDSGQWSTVGRSRMRPADAMVYNLSGRGHIFLYEHGDGWGWMMAYEAKGCSYGITHNLRQAASSYHSIRRAGF